MTYSRSGVSFSMNKRRRLTAIVPVTALLIAWMTPVAAQDLKSWNDTETKSAIMAFVDRVTTEGGADYVPPDERIAVFDNDGTLWSEKPYYFQLAFAFDRIKAQASEHPEWKDNPILKAAIDGDLKTVMAGGEHALLEIVMATHAGMTTDQFERTVEQWIDTARHPQTGMRYTDMVFQPMLELMQYLRAHQFETWIVSGGGIEFMRPWSQRVYGVPPQQVIGSSIEVNYEVRDGVPVLVRLPEINFIDDKAGKPVGIHRFIGRRPIAAFGNSDGDLQMLQWTTAGDGARFGLIVHHTDQQREYAYDRESSVGRLDKGFAEAADRGWTLVDIKKDWSQVYPQPNAKDAASRPSAPHHYFAKDQHDREIQRSF